MIQFPTQKFAWFQTVEDANNWYFERKFSGPNFVWTLADIGNCIVFFSFNFAKLYHISVACVFCHVTFWRQKASRRIIRVTTLAASSFHESSKVLSLHNNVFNLKISWFEFLNLLSSILLTMNPGFRLRQCNLTLVIAKGPIFWNVCTFWPPL